MPPRSLNRPQHERMYRIFKMIQGGSFPNCNQFCEETEANRRTILRDLDYLRDRMRLPIEFDRKQNGYYFTEPVTDFPVIEISESDLLMLFIAERASATAAASGLEGQLRASFARLAPLLGASLQTTWSELDQLLSIRSTGASKTDVKAFEILRTGIAKRKQVRFSYLPLEASCRSTRTVHPQHLGYVNGQWYLFAFDPQRDALRTFSLSRMKSARLLQATFAKDDQSPRLPELLDESFGVIYAGKELQRVRAVFLPPISRLVGERQWHPSQSFKPLKDGRVEMTMEVRHLKEVANWLSSWGASVEVLEPAKLRAEMIQRARNTVALYEK